MSKPVFSDLFRLSGRRNRKSYLLYALTNFLLLIVIWGIVGASMSEDDMMVPLLLGGLPSAICILSGWIVAGQRCRDFGWTGWAILLSLVPLVGWIFAFALFFVPGTLGPNRYGPDPLEPVITPVA